MGLGHASLLDLPMTREFANPSNLKFADQHWVLGPGPHGRKAIRRPNYHPELSGSSNDQDATTTYPIPAVHPLDRVRQFRCK